MQIDWNTIIAIAAPLALGFFGVMKNVNKAIKEQREFSMALGKFVKHISVALADNNLDNKEIEKILNEYFPELLKELQDVTDAYEEIGKELSNLITRTRANGGKK